MKKIDEVGVELGVAATCKAVGLPRATYYRRRGGQEPKPSCRRPPARKLCSVERNQVLEVLHEPRFMDWAPVQVWAQLLDEGSHLCSVRTMHRILAENAEARERRDQLRRPRYELSVTHIHCDLAVLRARTELTDGRHSPSRWG